MKIWSVILLTGRLLFSGYQSCLALDYKQENTQKTYLKAETVSKPGFIGDTITYHIQVRNISDVEQTIFFNVNKPRELACETSLSEGELTLKPGDEQGVTLRIVMSDRIPLGGFENCVLSAKNKRGQALAELKFSSTNAKSHPFLLVTDGLIDEVKEKVKNYDWAKNNFNSMLEALDDFQFPTQKIVTKPRPTKVWSSLSYVASDGEKAFQLALAYRLTGDKKYKDKLIAFIQKLTDPTEGYLSVGAATTGVQVHEGNFFLHLAAACDVIYDELSETDHENIVATFRLYLKQNRSHMNSLGIMNHQASANAGAILVAIYLQDVAEVEYLTNADGGMADQISKGVMADGWWFEGTVNYCYLVTQRYCLVAQAFENYGWDLYHKRFPVEYKSKDFDNAKEGFTGMKFDNWGPTGKSTRGVEDMVGCYVDFMDHNAVVVSSNDSRATKPDPYYELAYREFGGDELAWVLSKTERSSWISLLYGVAELPEVADPRTKSTFAPNVGITALRSQKAELQAKDQIEAYLKFGTHGGWHGQFDRTGLLALNRNDHKYFGTEMAWFGYGHPGYKECVQTSATHNMVMVDELQQEAVPSDQLLFYAGSRMQVSVTQTIARWRKIPTFNIEKFPPWNDKEFDPDFEPVLQRRLAVVTDDYVVLADYMKAPQKHTYDWLMHPIGFMNIEGAKKTGGVLDTVNTHFESPYKYFTQGQWYKTKSGSKLQFDEDGNKLDVYNLWPKKTELLVAHYPYGGKGDRIKNNPERRTFALRVNEKEVVYLVVLEPYQGASSIKKIESQSVDKVTVHLSDGRTQFISISNLIGDGSDIMVRLEEKAGNSTIVEESMHSL